MRGDEFRNNYFNRYSGNKQNNYRQHHFSNPNNLEPENYRGYRSNQYQNRNNVQEDISSRSFQNTPNHPPQSMNSTCNFSFHQQPPQPTYIDFSKMNETFESNIKQGRTRLRVYKKYLERLECLLEDSKEYTIAVRACKDAYSDFGFVNCLNKAIKKNCIDLSQKGIFFVEFQNICKGLRHTEENVSNAIKWIQKQRRNNKNHFETILQVVMEFFTMLLHRKDIDKNLVRRLLSVLTRLIEFLGGCFHEYKSVLLKMKDDFSVLFCLIKLHDNDDSLTMKWDNSIQKGLCRLDRKFKELLSSNVENMMKMYEELKAKTSSYDESNNDLYNSLMVNSKELEEILNKDKASECEKYINECDGLHKRIQNWLDRQCDDMRRTYQNSGNSFTNTSYEIQNSFIENTNVDNRNWFEKQFYPSYCSLFVINDNNVQYQPIDPSEYGPLENVKEVSEDIQNLFARYKQFLDGNTDSIQLISTNNYERFNSFMKLKSVLREDVKQNAIKDDIAYSENFVNDLEEIDYKDPMEMDKTFRDSNEVLGTHDFARYLSGDGMI